jgi:hypothetical protein
MGELAEHIAVAAARERINRIEPFERVAPRR